MDDVEYLQGEAEALKYVIGQAPYAQSGPDGEMSVLNRLRLIDHAQINYYRPIIEKVYSEDRIVNLSGREPYENTFEPAGAEDADIYKTLNKIIKHRAALINICSKISLFDWEKGVKDYDNQIISLFAFAGRMIREERKHLKKIADLVLYYQKKEQKSAEK